ncbi:hypothetical protein EON66_10855, partial [archaeon]
HCAPPSPPCTRARPRHRAGTFPPVGHRQQFRTLIDEHIQLSAGDKPVYAGSGCTSFLCKLPYEQLLRLSCGAEADIVASARLDVPHVGVHSASSPVPHDKPAAAQTHELPRTVSRPRFLVDGMLGRLMRWLRVIGVDAECASDYTYFMYLRSKGRVNPAKGGKVVLSTEAMFAWAEETDRIVVSRDKKLFTVRSQIATRAHMVAARLPHDGMCNIVLASCPRMCSAARRPRCGTRRSMSRRCNLITSRHASQFRKSRADPWCARVHLPTPLAVSLCTCAQGCAGGPHVSLYALQRAWIRPLQQ